MAKAYEGEYRRNFLSAYEQGYGTLEELAAEFRVSLGWAKKVSAAYTRTGSMAGPTYKPGRKPKIRAAEQALLRQWLAAQPDLTLAELQIKLDEQAGVKIHNSCLCRWLKRMGLRLKKKSLHAAERDTPENLIGRQEFLAAIAEVDPEHLVFLDETGLRTSMTRLYGRAPAGVRVAEAAPESPWSVVTLLAALRLTGMVAPMTIPAATDGEIFSA